MAEKFGHIFFEDWTLHFVFRPPRRRKLKTESVPLILELCLTENRVVMVMSSFSKSSFLKLISVHTKVNGGPR